MSAHADERQSASAAEERSHDRTIRVLALLRLLHRRSSVTRQEIARELHEFYGTSADRAIRRDIATLAGRAVADLLRPGDPALVDLPLGLDVRYDRADDRFILVASDFAPQLGEAEYELLQALRAELPDDPLLRPRLDALIERLCDPASGAFSSGVQLHLGVATDYRPHAQTLRRLDQAARGRRSVRFRYQPLRSAESQEVERVEVDPLELRDGHYYVEGFYAARDAYREFRVDRIEPGSLQILPDYGARRSRHRRLVTVSYWLSPRLATGGVSRRLIDQRQEESPDGGAIITGQTRNLFYVRRLLLGYGAQAQALAPPELVTQMADEIRAMAAAYTMDASDFNL